MKKIILLLLVFLLMLSGCHLISKPTHGDQPPIDSGDPDDKPKQPIYTERAGFDWQPDDLAAIAFLGYADDTQFGYYSETAEFENFVLFYSGINYLTKVYDEGDEVYVIIPRYKESEVTITTKDQSQETLYHEDGEGGVLLKTNLSDLHASTQVTIKLDDQELVFDPSLDNAEGKLILPDKGLKDLSFYISPDFEDLRYNIFTFKGSWKSEYRNNQGEAKSVRLIFHGLDHSSDHDYHELSYIDEANDEVSLGVFYFNVPIDFKEPMDENTNLVYVEWYSRKSDPHQSFGKFAYQFLDFDTLLLKHVSYDPLVAGEEDYLYILKRN